MRMLVSVRDVGEARVAADGGADFIDCKEPRAGALGGLAVETIGAIVEALPHTKTTASCCMAAHTSSADASRASSSEACRAPLANSA